MGCVYTPVANSRAERVSGWSAPMDLSKEVERKCATEGEQGEGKVGKTGLLPSNGTAKLC